LKVLVALALAAPVVAFLPHSAVPSSFLKRVSVGSVSSVLQAVGNLDALIFDCDGVLADTERDGHRVSFNKAFKEKGIDCEWSVEKYGQLLETGGGKERMTAHWNEAGWPQGYEGDARVELVKELHKRKTELFNELICAGEIPLRAGVLRLVDEAIAARVTLAVCSTSNEVAVTNIVETLMGPERAAKFTIFAGDCVPQKKPAPDIYLLARDTLKLDAAKCMVVEDSHIGHLSAKRAGMGCIVTKSSYTAEEDFSLADAVVDELGETGPVTLELLARIPGNQQ